MITAKGIKNELRAIWPNLDGNHGMLLLQDTEYMKPNIVDIEEIISGLSFEYDGEVSDCDDFALIAHATIKLHYYKNGSKYPVAFGECIGTMFNGIKSNHTKNICYSDTGIVLVEPKDRTIKIPDEGDLIWFVKM